MAFTVDPLEEKRASTEGLHELHGTYQVQLLCTQPPDVHNMRARQLLRTVPGHETKYMLDSGCLLVVLLDNVWHCRVCVHHEA